MGKKSVIFICTANACRSQIAESLMRAMGSDRFDVFSAGSQAAGYIHPVAINAMAEVGLDIRAHQSKSLNNFAGQSFDYVITVCDHAAANCPFLRGRLGTFHWPIPDPVRVQDPNAAAQLARAVREDLRGRIEAFIQSYRDQPL